MMGLVRINLEAHYWRYTTPESNGGVIIKLGGLGGIVNCGNAWMDCAITGKNNLHTTPSIIKIHRIQRQHRAQEKIKKQSKIFEAF